MLMEEVITTTPLAFIAFPVVVPVLLLDLLLHQMSGMLQMQLTRMLVIRIRLLGAPQLLLDQVPYA